ncbi:hypothetical protein M404DRAFT_23539 [Pisolithus tinctorius Marx 270]|uniref:Uncharacterized protein n=1 Tax=Pisolithus tinctorius Marx 270 TaxID=870435 RepID=A0A0C3KDG4_PISTI|nr:hypothetical protein M404DRAFT_23539 [Pisolithus tinctorius Marx 270]
MQRQPDHVTITAHGPVTWDHMTECLGAGWLFGHVISCLGWPESYLMFDTVNLARD